MLDQLYGKPSSSWKRSQVFLVLLFWSSRIVAGNPKGPRLFFLRRLNRFLSRFTPWQIILSTFTIIYGIKHSDAILGLQAPEPLARLYSRVCRSLSETRTDAQLTRVRARRTTTARPG